jgi:hypothetical protein
MSLFQICYGPEIGEVLQTVQKYQGISKEDLINKYQYHPEGDISSLVDAALNFLVNLNFINIDNSKNIWAINGDVVNELSIIFRLKEITDQSDNLSDPNYIFSSMYYQLFVVPNQMYLKDLYYEANVTFNKLAISLEKVNAWKRIMEYLGLGYRVYGGFYALPHFNLMSRVIQEIGNWEGPMQLLFEEKINPIVPCVYNGKVFNGFLFSVINMYKVKMIDLSKKQDLPYTSYGEKKQWNWVEIGGVQS